MNNRFALTDTNDSRQKDVLAGESLPSPTSCKGERQHQAGRDSYTTFPECQMSLAQRIISKTIKQIIPLLSSTSSNIKGKSISFPYISMIYVNMDVIENGIKYMLRKTQLPFPSLIKMSHSYFST